MIPPSITFLAPAPCGWPCEMKKSMDKWVNGQDHLDCKLSCRNTKCHAISGNRDDATQSSVEVRIEFPDEVGEHEVAVHCPLCGSDEIKAKVIVKNRETRMRHVKTMFQFFALVSTLGGASCLWSILSEPDDLTSAWLLAAIVLIVGYSILEIAGKGLLSRAAAATEGLTGHLIEFTGVGRRHSLSTD